MPARAKKRLTPGTVRRLARPRNQQNYRLPTAAAAAATTAVATATATATAPTRLTRTGFVDLQAAVAVHRSVERLDRRTRLFFAHLDERFINIKPGRVGGLTPAVAIHNLCSRAKIPCWVGGMLESAVGAAHSIALAMLDNFTYPADIFPSSRFYHEDLSNPPIELVRSGSATPMVRARMQLPEPVPDRLEKATLQSAAISD